MSAAATHEASRSYRDVLRKRQAQRDEQAGLAGA
jgi:hypothetical protein